MTISDPRLYDIIIAPVITETATIARTDRLFMRIHSVAHTSVPRLRYGRTLSNATATKRKTRHSNDIKN